MILDDNTTINFNWNRFILKQMLETNYPLGSTEGDIPFLKRNFWVIKTST
jgi:hypothetical protein